MSTLAATDIEQLVRQYVASEIVCQTLAGDSSRVGCVMPLQYGSGDSVVVWIERWGDRFRVSDYGEATLDAPGRSARDLTDLAAQAADLCRPFGVEVRSGALVTQATRDELGDAVWRTATAAVVVAQVASTFRQPRRHDRERRFAQEVERELAEHHVPFQREVKLAGSSGHEHRATLYVPTVEAIVEPIDAGGHFNQISSIYTKFGDLAHVNGYRRLSLVDDRGGGITDDLAAMLVQVSDVVRWTRRDEWLRRLKSN